jgi:hypothetical protein
MILKGSQRAGGRQLAAHLLRADENEHVEVHELRGFVAEDLDGAFAEAYAASKGTRAKQFLFSLSLNPPPTARLSKGFRGIWDRLTGRHANVKHQNEREALIALGRDREEKDSLIFRHIEERERLEHRIRDEKKTQALDVQRLHRDVANFMEQRAGRSPNLREHFRGATGQRKDFNQSRDRDFEPEI